MAELADAQVSEACDGDIVEVQVLSSAPSKPSIDYADFHIRQKSAKPVGGFYLKIFVTDFRSSVFFHQRFSLKGEY